jgi:hypothetical protein
LEREQSREDLRELSHAAEVEERAETQGKGEENREQEGEHAEGEATVEREKEGVGIIEDEGGSVVEIDVLQVQKASENKGTLKMKGQWREG